MAETILDYDSLEATMRQLFGRNDLDEVLRLCALYTSDALDPERNLSEIERANRLGSIVRFEADAVSMRKDYDGARSMFSEYLRKYKHIADRDIVVTVQAGYANNELRFQNYPEALNVYLESLPVFEQIGNRIAECGTCCNIGTVYVEIGSYAEAAAWYAKAMDIAKAIDFKPFLANITLNLGIIYMELEDIETAIEYQLRALSMLEEINDLPGQANTYNNLVGSHRRLKRYDEALAYADKAVALALEIQDLDALDSLYNTRGSLYYDLKRYDDALADMHKGLLLSNAEKPSKQRLSLLQNICHIHAHREDGKQDLREAERFIETARSQWNDTFGNFARSALLSHEHSLRAKLEQWQRAYECAEEALRLEKNMHQDEARETARKLELSRRIENDERDRQVKLARLQEHEKLLYRVLPSSIAQRMSGGEDVIADYFESVSILFADIKGFTALTSEMPAFLLVRFLGSIFQGFDEIMQRHGCEKIKTIGDGYMAVCGAPLKYDDHAERLIMASFDMLHSISIPDEVRDYVDDDFQLGVRIGIHMGPVVAGVVGKDRFVYDIYSDAVNTASRMESHGEVQRIHVSSEFARHLQNRQMLPDSPIKDLQIIRRGEIEVKGKGVMKTCFVERKSS